jgi:hypothetical protein
MTRRRISSNLRERRAGGRIRDIPGTGTFRAKVNRLTLMNGASCLGDTSPGRHHTV